MYQVAKGAQHILILTFKFKNSFLKGFLRKAKVGRRLQPFLPSTIDKDELHHSTWPASVYCQAETRHVVQDGVNI